MKRILLSFLFISAVSFVSAQGRMNQVIGEEITYKSADGTVLKGYIAYD